MMTTIRDIMVEFLESTPRLSDFYDETCWIADQVNIILNDSDDDKLGRIRDVYNKEINYLAKWVEDNLDSHNNAQWLLNEAKKAGF